MEGAKKAEEVKVAITEAMANTKEALSNADLLTSLPSWCQRKGTRLYWIRKCVPSVCYTEKIRLLWEGYGEETRLSRA
jgi:hypothetical protein